MGSLPSTLCAGAKGATLFPTLFIIQVRVRPTSLSLPQDRRRAWVPPSADAVREGVAHFVAEVLRVSGLLAEWRGTRVLFDPYP